MTTQQSNSQVTVYLTSSRDWDSWLPVAKAYSLTLKVWDYMNPDMKESLLPTESSRSTVSQVKADTTTIVDLKEDELTQYSYLREN